MHGQCDARPMVTFPAINHYRPLAGTNLYCLVTELHVCEQLYRIVREAVRPGLESATHCLQVRCPNQYATTPPHRPLVCTKLYCLVSEAHACEQRYMSTIYASSLPQQGHRIRTGFFPSRARFSGSSRLASRLFHGVARFSTSLTRCRTSV